MNSTALAAGVISVLLGGLWLLQGLGVVQIRPILCFANCAAIQGPSLTWVIVGLIVVTAGTVAIFYALRWRARR
jgi:hypothetical protein